MLHEAAYEYWYRGGGRLFKTQMPKNFSDWVMIIEDSCDKCFKIQSRISSLDQHAQNVDNILVYFFFKSLCPQQVTNLCMCVCMRNRNFGTKVASLKEYVGFLF